MSVVEARTSLWQSLAGRPTEPLPADADVWRKVAERLNPAKARPKLRWRVEEVPLSSARGGSYVMFASPDRLASYVRLGPEEAALARLMDGTRTVAQLVGEFARATGRLAPDQVTRVVADLAGGRMLEELPVDAFAPVASLRRRPWPLRVGRGVLRFAAGRRMVLANPDRAAGIAYRSGGWLLFTRAGVAAMVLVSVWGFALFARTWAGGSRQALVAGGSYSYGALVLLALNVAGLLVHESGHALGVKHAGRRAPAVGVMCYFGIPSAFVDTTDMWMASRRHRLITTAAGPGFTIAFAGAVQIASLWLPGLAPLAFPLGLAWYLNSLFNLNPLMALDGYYLVMDWLEVPNLRPRATALICRGVRYPSTLRGRREGEERLVARYAVLSLLWLVCFTGVSVRSYKDRLRGAVAGLWHTGWGGRALLATLIALLGAPLAYVFVRWIGRRPAAMVEALRRRRRDTDGPRRLDALRASQLGALEPAVLEALAADARWARTRRGAEVVAAGAAVTGVVVVVDGELEGRRPGDPWGQLRGRAGAGDVVGVNNVLAGRPSSLSWTAAGTRLLVVPASTFAAAVGPQPSPTGDPGELETLLERSDVFGALLPEDRAVLAQQLTPTDLEPGRRFKLSGSFVALVGAGVIATSDGAEARPGGLVGPSTGEPIVATARSRARVWPFEAKGALSVVLASAGSPALVSHHAPEAGMHGDDYGPLVLPWGTPPPTDDGGSEEQLTRRLGKLLVLLLLVALLAMWLAVPAGTPWAEVPADTAVVAVGAGTVDVVVDGEPRVLRQGDRLLLRAGDGVAPRPSSLAVVEFRGGARVLLCPAAAVEVGSLESAGSAPIVAAAELRVGRGRVLAATASTSPDFAPLRLAVTLADGAVVTSDGPAVFAAGSTGLEIGTGDVVADGGVVEQATSAVSCGRGQPGFVELPPVEQAAADGSVDRAGVAVSTPPSTVDDDTEPMATTTTKSTVPGATTVTTGLPPTTTSSLPDSPLVDGPPTTPAAPPGPPPTLPPPTTRPPTTTIPTRPTSTSTTRPTTTTTRPPTTTTRPPTTTTRPPTTTTTTTRPSTTTTTAPNRPPTITRFTAQGASVHQQGPACGTPTTLPIIADVQDADDPPSALTVRFSYVLSTDRNVAGEVGMSSSGGATFTGTLGPFAQGSVPASGGTFTLTLLASDGGGQAPPSSISVPLDRC